MVKEYSRKKDGSLRLTEHFQVWEFACQDGTDRILHDSGLSSLLEKLYGELIRRGHAVKALHVVSGYRTPAHDKAVGGSGKGQHVEGRAADVNVELKGEVPGALKRGNGWFLDGKYICTALQDLGCQGIGYMGGRAVHCDTRASRWWGDETTGNDAIGDWYAYFGMEKPGEAAGNPYAEPAGLLQKGSQGNGVRWVQWQLSQAHGHGEVAVDGLFGDKTEAAVLAVQREAGLSADGIVGPDTRAALLEKPGAPESGAPSVVYQVYTAANKWLPEVTDYGEGSDGYAGYPGHAVQGVRARLTRGSIEYRVHIANRWLPWVKDRQDYAGLYGKDADGLQMRLVGLDGYAVEYRVARKDGGYWAWVRNYGEGSEGYAGSFGQPFDRLQCRIVRA